VDFEGYLVKLNHKLYVDQYTTIHQVYIHNENTQNTQDTEGYTMHSYDAMDVIKLYSIDSQSSMTLLYATLVTMLGCKLKETAIPLEKNVYEHQIYKISYCRVVQIRDKTKEKLLFYDPDDVDEPLKPLHSKLRRYFSEFYKFSGNLYISDPRASLVTSPLARYSLVLLVSDRSSNHFNLCLTHKHVCKLLKKKDKDVTNDRTLAQTESLIGKEINTPFFVSCHKRNQTGR